MSELYNIFPIKDAETQASVATFDGAAVGLPLAELEVAIAPMQSGSGDPSPSNVRPITGRTEANIVRTGKNLFDEPNATVYKRFIRNSDDKWMGDSGSSSYAFPCKPDTDYAVTANNENLTIFKVGYANVETLENGIQLYNVTRLTSAGTIQIHTGADATYIIVQCSYAIINAKNTQLQIEYGTTASAYEAYIGNTYAVDWTSAAGTVYAGSYEAASGKLKARPQYSAYNGETLVGPWLSSMDVYEEGATPTTGAQVVDLGGTETEYAITPQSIIPIVGQNYVWANCGDINSLQYYVEPDGLVRDVCINGRSLENDGWYIKWRRLSAPKPKFDFIPIYGKDGSIDQTEALGDVFYENRDVNVDMVYVGDDWNGAYSNLLNAVHGRSCYVQFADDPYWYWSGRLNVSEFDHKSRLLTMAGIVFPYKLNINKNEYSASVSGATEQTAVGLQLAGSRMRVSPEVIVTGNVTLKWGEMTAALSDGTYHVGGLKVGSDGVTIKVWGTGSVTISYREGIL